MNDTSVPAVPARSAEPAVALVGAVDIRERRAWHVNGFLGLLIALVLGGLAVVLLLWSASRTGTSLPDGDMTGSVGVVDIALIVLALLCLVLAVSLLASTTVIQPGQTRVVQLFGRYVGTARTAGLVTLLPWTSRRNVTVRVNNFDTPRLKVNDAAGNPVEIAAIVVWQVADTAKSTFAVEDTMGFVQVQAEAAVRHVARSYPYDGPEGSESLRGSTDVISSELAREVAERVVAAGVQILEVRISHLAYAPEIAQAMLQRQQAAAVVAARSTIVEGAVGMVQMALAELSRQGVVDLDEERRAAMVSNLLVVLCGDSRVSPVVNTGTLYA
ncbi:MAG: SPFH domain-containing protein [Kineosporiaceae bacterium]|nr:SPFH domain-containing protein [Kineosporiaceae bacterium]